MAIVSLFNIYLRMNASQEHRTRQSKHQPMITRISWATVENCVKLRVGCPTFLRRYNQHVSMHGLALLRSRYRDSRRSDRSDPLMCTARIYVLVQSTLR